MKDMVIKRLLRRSGKNGTGDFIVYFRNQLVWDGIRYPYFEVSTKIRILNPKQWDQKAQHLKGSSDAVRRLNKQIQDKQNAVETFWKKFSVNNNVLEFKRLKRTVNSLMGGKDAAKHSEENIIYVPSLFDLHIQNGKPRGGEYSSARKKRYEFIRDMVAKYCVDKYRTTEVTLDKLGKPFYNDCRRFIQQHLKLKQTTIQGYMKVFEAAVKSEWERSEYPTKNPFTGCKTAGGKTTRMALTLEELNQIKELTDESLGENCALVRDIFLFACYTGMSYCDLKGLTKDYIQVLEGEEYLVKDREKNCNHSNSNFFSVPITQDVRALLRKFSKHPRISGTDLLIPMMCNSDYNKQLKIIKAAAGIRKNLSSHIARHTMACLFLEGGGSLEVLMKMLGHSRITQTQEYGKIRAARISKEAREALNYFSNRDAKIIPINIAKKEDGDGSIKAFGRRNF
jgi:integrase